MSQEQTLPERDFERLKASLVSLISHELRTPLTYISASLEMLEIAYESPEMKGEVKRFLNIIDQGVQQLNTTIDELLMFSSLEQASPEPSLLSPSVQEVDIQQLILEVVNILKPTYQARQQVFEVAIQPDLPGIVVDSSKLSEIILQLLSNAIKFTPLKGHIRLMVMQVEQRLQILVSDTGPGIPPEVRAQIFDPFYQKEDYLTREKGGLGLGLTLVQRLCHAIGAQLEMSAEEGHYTGTNFMIWLPLAPASKPQEPDFQQTLEQLQKLTHSHAEKEAQLNSYKAQLLKYTEDLYYAYQSNEQKQTALDSIYLDMMSGFASALQVRDPYTRGRSQRIANYADLLADSLDLSQEQSRILQQACLLCDIGYIGISDEVLHKSDSAILTTEERSHIHTHPYISTQMIRHIKAFEPLVPVILHHHENWDGSGYPQGLKGKDIPYLSRVIRIVDAFDAMLSDRSYRPRFEPAYALEEIRRHAGSQFDPELVKLFTGLWDSGKLQPLITSAKPYEEG